MPADDCLRLNDNHRLAPLRPQAPESYPQGAIKTLYWWSGILFLENGELLAQRQVLQGYIHPLSKHPPESMEEDKHS